MNTTKPTSKVNRLTHAEFYKLCEWLKTAKLNLPARELAAQAAAELPNPKVGAANVTAAAETLNITIGEVRRRRVPGERVDIVARELANLMRELGKEPSKDLLSVVHRKGKVSVDTPVPKQPPVKEPLPFQKWQKGDVLRVVSDSGQAFKVGDLVEHDDTAGNPTIWVRKAGSYRNPIDCQHLEFVHRP